MLHTDKMRDNTLDAKVHLFYSIVHTHTHAGVSIPDKSDYTSSRGEMQSSCKFGMRLAHSNTE